MSPIIEVCRVEELPVGAVKRIETVEADIGVVNCGGELLALEDRCSHDDGILFDGPLDTENCVIECPRHGSRFDIRTGRPLNLPAYEPVDTFPVLVEDGVIKLEVE